MDYWHGIAGRTATFTLRDGKGTKVVSFVGTKRGSQPQALEPYGDTGPLPYPIYEVITVDGVTDVIEHRQLEPIFRVTDDPVVWQKLGVQ